MGMGGMKVRDSRGEGEGRAGCVMGVMKGMEIRGEGEGSNEWKGRKFSN